MAHEPAGRRRTDAQRNRERVVRAALETFAEHGVQVTMAQIAARAGVGKATVFRCFPTKEDLIAEVAGMRREWLRERLIQALDAPDVGEGFAGFVRDAVHTARGDRMLGQAVRAVAAADMNEQERDLTGLGEQLVARAVAAGVVRADATGADLRLLLSGVAQALARDGDYRPASWNRAAVLVLRALSPDGFSEERLRAVRGVDRP